MSIDKTILASRFNQYDLIVEHAEMATVKDQSNFSYIDFVMGNLTQIHGHNA
jgi:glutamate-1-semialdehyde aminotransferase